MAGTPAAENGSEDAAQALWAIEYVKSLGVDPLREKPLFDAQTTALLRGLPEGWTRQRDDVGRTYYWNEFTGDSTWSHPDHDLYVAAVGLYRTVQTEPNPGQVLKRVLMELESETFTTMDAAAARWVCRFTEDGDPFWHDASSGVSVWHDPHAEITRRHKLRAWIIHAFIRDVETRGGGPAAMSPAMRGNHFRSTRFRGNFGGVGGPAFGGALKAHATAAQQMSHYALMREVTLAARAQAEEVVAQHRTALTNGEAPDAQWAQKHSPKPGRPPLPVGREESKSLTVKSASASASHSEMAMNTKAIARMAAAGHKEESALSECVNAGRQAVEMTRRREAAALRIQKAWRGYVQRRDLKKSRKGQEIASQVARWKSQMHNAAVVIQRAWRRYEERQRLRREGKEILRRRRNEKLQLQRTKSVKDIQRVWRGTRARMRSTEERAVAEEARRTGRRRMQHDDGSPRGPSSYHADLKDSPLSSTSSCALTERETPEYGVIDNKAQETAKYWHSTKSDLSATTPKALPRLPSRRQAETVVQHGGRIITRKLGGDFEHGPVKGDAASTPAFSKPSMDVEPDALSREVAAAVQGFYAGMTSNVTENIAAVRTNVVRLTNGFQQANKERSNRLSVDLSSGGMHPRASSENRKSSFSHSPVPESRNRSAALRLAGAEVGKSQPRLAAVQSTPALPSSHGKLDAPEFSSGKDMARQSSSRERYFGKMDGSPKRFPNALISPKGHADYRSVSSPPESGSRGKDKLDSGHAFPGAPWKPLPTRDLVRVGSNH